MDKPTHHLDTASAARRAGVSGDTIRRWCRLGYLHPIRVGVGRRYRIDADDLAAVIGGTVQLDVPADEIASPHDPRTRRSSKAVQS